MAQFQAVDSTYGSLHLPVGSAETITVSVQGTKYGIKAFSAGVLSGITADTADATADHLTVPANGAGDYFINFNADATAINLNDAIEVSIFVNGTENANIHGNGFHDDLYITLAANDTVDVRVSNESGTGNIIVRTADLTILRVGQ
jgi:hypothetical protein